MFLRSKIQSYANQWVGLGFTKAYLLTTLFIETQDEKSQSRSIMTDYLDEVLDSLVFDGILEVSPIEAFRPKMTMIRDGCSHIVRPNFSMDDPKVPILMVSHDMFRFVNTIFQSGLMDAMEGQSSSNLPIYTLAGTVEPE